MAEVTTYEPRVSLSAITVGALTAFIVDLAFMLLGTGLFMAMFQLEAGEEIGTLGYIVSAVFLIIGAFVSYAAGGYVAGYFSPQRSVVDSRVHGFASFALAGLLMAFLIGGTAASGAGMFANATTSYLGFTGRAPVVTDAARTRPTTANRPTTAEVREAAADVRRASAGTFITLVVLMIEGTVVSYWAGGEAYLRRARRGVGNITREQARVA